MILERENLDNPMQEDLDRRNRDRDAIELAVEELNDGLTDRYTKAEVDSKFDLKADVNTVDEGLSDRYTKDETDGLLAEKANKQHEDWIEPTLLNGFTGKLRYRINQFNNLEIIGSLTFTSNITANALPAFQLPMSYIPNWFSPGANYTDLRFKFSIPTDTTHAGSARATLSSFNGNFIIVNGNNFNQWHINISIPMNA